MTDEQIEAALNACTFGQTKETRCKNCALDCDKEPCITNLHLAALKYIRRLKHRAEVAERALLNLCVDIQPYSLFDLTPLVTEASVKMQEYLQQAEKELAEERKDD